MLLQQKADQWLLGAGMETFGSDRYFQYFDCGDGLWVYIYINLAKYILPLCQLHLNKAV